LEAKIFAKNWMQYSKSLKKKTSLIYWSSPFNDKIISHETQNKKSLRKINLI
jgi:hypothetical protein